ncbi:MAG: division/cell wall cluster transcriptional repressor MraZ [Lachnospiraceae bacterium]|nr:division/cell wall cluster transcriptional repressor MraZ [Lachnospiraceae bacterium]
MLMGTYSHSLDAKGRLIIPAQFRKNLGESFVLTKSPDHCLALYSEEEWMKQIEATNTLPKLTNEAARRFRRIYFGNSTSAELDKQGRILIPQALRAYAGLTKDVTLVGVTDHVEVWDEKTWNAYNEENDLTEILSDLENVDL